MYVVTDETSISVEDMIFSLSVTWYDWKVVMDVLYHKLFGCIWLEMLGCNSFFDATYAGIESLGYVVSSLMRLISVKFRYG